ncbi:PHD-domain-containing protein [Trichodelitschia bisporula]|uniref:PHD-domain-containing protein n=1 Tax=Trichodelitschia bisporula TaxID=703511 RepID=A0A6G1HHS7_9PEZI|nr:PHD-domain-containing protein [Trichodelitschia bisporula]
MASNDMAMRDAPLDGPEPPEKAPASPVAKAEPPHSPHDQNTLIAFIDPQAANEESIKVLSHRGSTAQPDAIQDTVTVQAKKRPTPRSTTKKGMAKSNKKNTSSKKNTKPAPSATGTDPPSDDDPDQAGPYCICRGPDDYTPMIECDACKDWFHAKCVQLTESEMKLADKYFCPNCEAAGHGATMWKPMCRNKDCNEPAATGSKYCAPACGMQMMADMLKRGGPVGATADPQGGPLCAEHLKALLHVAPDLKSFHALGSKVFLADGKMPVTFTPAENARLAAMADRKEDLRAQRTLCKERSKFITKCREALVTYAEKECLNVKDVCGYDSRLAWSDARFAEFVARGGDEMEVDGEEGKFLCPRKRCERHRNWQKGSLQDVRLEEGRLADEMRQVDREEEELREGAMLRARNEGAGGEPPGYVVMAGE